MVSKINNLNNLNKIKTNTWRWLNVNELNLGSTNIDYDKTYNTQNLKLTNGNSGEIEIKVDSKNASNTNIFENMNYGVSKELLELNINSCNISTTLQIPDNVNISEPLILEYTLDNENNTLLDINDIFVGENSKATVILKYTSKDNTTEGFHTGTTRIHAKKNSKIKLVKLQDLNDFTKHFDSNVVLLEEDSQVENIDLQIGAKIAVSNVISELLGNNSNFDIKSIYFGDKDKLIDISSTSNHIGKASISNMDVKGVVKDNVKKVFKGTLDFKKGSSKSKGSELEQVIILSPTVKVDSALLLLCTEDDVNGAHAANIGKLDENKLFYLMSRGFSKKQAEILIIEGIFEQILANIPDEDLGNYIMEKIKLRIENE